MKQRILPGFFLVAFLMVLVVFTPETVQAQSSNPFGVGAPPAPAPVGGGFLRENLGWIYQKQAEFYRELNGFVKQAKQDGSAVWGLILLSFLYGIFHAAGPGHGKIVISTYMLANEHTARRGIIISFLAAFMQGVVAVSLITVATFVLQLTSFALTETTQWFERGSYLLIAALGAFLLWQKGVLPLVARQSQIKIVHEPGCSHGHHNHYHTHDHDCGCGGHAADPNKLQQSLTVRSAGAAILSVGLRPCSGALIVLVFAASQGLYWVGVVSTFAMAFGTAITVSTLAFIAVVAKGIAGRYLAVGGQTQTVFKTVELLGASLLLLLGATLFAASLTA